MSDSNNNNKSGFKIRTFSFRSKKGKDSKSSSQKKKAVNGVATKTPPAAPTLCQATTAFKGIEPCDLSFEVGDKITITTCTEKQFDWWEGRCKGKVGIFPANYVKVVSSTDS